MAISNCCWLKMKYAPAKRYEKYTVILDHLYVVIRIFLDMNALKVLILLAALSALLGCPTSSGEPTYTVHGTVTVGGATVTGNLVVTVTQGSNSFTVSVPLPVPILGVYTWTYSVAGVPAGTYSTTVSFNTPTQTWQGFYTLNGVLPSTRDDPVTSDVFPGPYTYTMTVPGISISADTQLDADMNWAG
jgi:hypothetical protein